MHFVWFFLLLWTLKDVAVAAFMVVHTKFVLLSFSVCHFYGDFLLPHKICAPVIFLSVIVSCHTNLCSCHFSVCHFCFFVSSWSFPGSSAASLLQELHTARLRHHLPNLLLPHCDLLLTELIGHHTSELSAE